ncbi:MAG: response regulator [Prevotellaceae bacterium]|jgi:DNA-binding response OmpR family regulator|nr:response regulator [Prevotellaceae bacterium]
MAIGKHLSQIRKRKTQTNRIPDILATVQDLYAQAACILSSLHELDELLALSPKARARMSSLFGYADRLYNLSEQLLEISLQAGEKMEQDTEKIDFLTGKNTPDTDQGVLLLVENDTDLRDYLGNELSAEFQIVNASDGIQALELARSLNPDIVMCDVAMSGLGGDELCRQLKSSVETSHISVVFLTALNERIDILIGLEAGANDYIVKPFDISVLKVRLHNILQSRRQLRQAILSSEHIPDEVVYATNQLDKEFLDKALGVIHSSLDDTTFAVNDFCRQLAMSRTAVYHKIKSLTGQSPNEFIRIIRLNKARELLLTRRYTVAEAAVMVGFADAKYFSTSFKKQFKVSPSKV